MLNTRQTPNVTLRMGRRLKPFERESMEVIRLLTTSSLMLWNEHFLCFHVHLESDNELLTVSYQSLSAIV